MSSIIRKRLSEDMSDNIYKKKRNSIKMYSLNKGLVSVSVSEASRSEASRSEASRSEANANTNTNKIYTQEEVDIMLCKQEQLFRTILEEKLREQFNVFNQIYIDNIFKDYQKTDFSYIN
jgi:hypothetical protein